MKFLSAYIILGTLVFGPGGLQAQPPPGDDGDRPPRPPRPDDDGGIRITCNATEQYMGEPELIGQEGPMPTPLRGNIGCVDMAAHSLRDTNLIPVPDDQDAFNIYGPMEAGFRSNNFGGMCIPEGETVPGGVDTNTAELMVAVICPEQNIQVLDACGGHAVPYHYHERMSCLYYDDPVTGHSTRIGTAGDGNGIYGKHIDGGVEPQDLDGCGGRYGVTPDSNGEVVYYYPVTSAPPFSLGCYGPATVEECRALYPDTCGEGATILNITTPFGSDEYTADCPCFDSNHSNVIGQGRPDYLPAITGAPTDAPIDTLPTAAPTAKPCKKNKNNMNKNGMKSSHHNSSSRRHSGLRSFFQKKRGSP